MPRVRRNDSTRAGAVASSIVGVILRAIEKRVGRLGRIVTGMLGMGWSLATYLIVPVLVLEDRELADSIRRSGQLLRENLGEQLVAGLHFGWVVLLLVKPQCCSFNVWVKSPMMDLGQERGFHRQSRG